VNENRQPQVLKDDILYVIGALDIGGTERHLSKVASALTQKGWRISVYSLSGDGPIRDELERAGVRVLLPPIDRKQISSSIVLRILRMALAGLHLAILMMGNRPHIVHFFLPEAYLVGGVAALVARIKARVMSRRSLNRYQQRYPLARNLESWLHKRMTAILGNSRAVIAELRNDEEVPEDKLVLIYNGVEMPGENSRRSRADVRNALGLETSSLVMIIVANLIPYKGHADLLEALGRAHSRLPSGWRLLVVGRDDGIKAKLKALARHLQIDRNVIFLGVRHDVRDLLLSSDIGLLVSHQEGFSNALLEGMAAGLPMIVTNVGGNPEAVTDGISGLIVPPGDPAQLSAAIEKLANDAEMRATMGVNARRRAEKEFSVDASIRRYEGLYEGLKAGKSPAQIPMLRSL
jgi:glycosyltransferase involved in cell wall biosynthesis